MMELQHVNAKIFVDGNLPFDPSRIIPVFHQWIQESTLPELLIDVADYGHVPGGPGILLVAHEADYSLDHTDHRWGLRYNRKAALEGSNQDRLRQAFRSAAHACHLLETTFANDGALQFSRHEFELFINDRALAPNSASTHAACKGELESFIRDQFGDIEVGMKYEKDPRRRYGVGITLSRPFRLDA